MSYETARQLVENKIQTDLDQTTFKMVPENFPSLSDQGQPWGRYSIRGVISDNADVGAQLRRREYILMFQLFVPEDTGTIAANQMADLIASTFDNLQETANDGANIIFRRASLRFIGQDPTGWYLHRVDVPFREDYNDIS